MRHSFSMLLLLVGLERTPALEVPNGFKVATLATNLNAATALAVAPDGRIFIADQTGPLRVWRNGRLLKTPALDLTGRVDDYWERGFIGVTLHPDFPHSPYLYVVYVAKKPFPHHVVSRFTMIGDRADLVSELVLLEGDDQKTLGGNVPHGHQGGPIRFGPDGKLYISIGEQTAGQQAQSLTTFQGKILRINTDGSIPNTNPFFTTAAGKYRAIWAYGVRNSFGLAVQPGSSRMFFTDVGGSAFEEVNELLRGANYGWPQAEGFSTNRAFTNPLHAYPPTIGRSIVGAAFAPENFPPPWRGKLFFADWAANWIKALDVEAPTNVTIFARGLDAPATIEFAPDGSLLVLDRGTLWREGKKWRPNSGSLLRISGGESSVQSRAPFPRTLREKQPGDTFTEFRLNVPPWQPGVETRGWISLPHGTAPRVNEDSEFEFPNGTVVIQQHIVQQTGTLFETHLFWFDLTDEPSRMARAATYRWHGHEAALIVDSDVIRLPGDATHRWFSPGPEERLDLDNVVTGFRLLLSPRQITPGHAAGWKLDDFPRLVALEDESAPLADRIRSYLDVNCAACHRPGGPSRGSFDARFVAPVAAQDLVNAEPVAGDLGITGARLITPGDPAKSILLQRLLRHDQFRMPPIAVNDDAQPVVIVLKEWIKELELR